VPEPLEVIINSSVHTISTGSLRSLQLLELFLEDVDSESLVCVEEATLVSVPVHGSLSCHGTGEETDLASDEEL